MQAKSPILTPTFNALADLTPLKKKPNIAPGTVSDGKAVKGSYAKANVYFQAGTAYVFRKVDGVGFYVDVAKGNVQYERGVRDKVVQLKPPMKKRKLSPSDDISVEAEEKSEEPRDAVSTRGKRDLQRA
ncbi:hypothetical protein PC129_g18317 [Phytophthora cactorum]|uniref:Uncharacterized protein n=1 Tax=Phytophthora cactorum TaxID=29920 RepID=A0A8T1HF96_9STRA|nr:hypothetical protein PC114_g20206 [Phytophthora cactorum]KAG3003084.1 hypothetical protein PC120_g19328 [Phytophthora cactorum]KAG3136175.1 hypothetical protein C6341_g21492 [Phytophthora cactorum]KAG3155814.1 hypothetical protein PC128_g21998 [Phytophthora cactorum]KAG3210688.1 hypothetical protein PC129_g18317 [Phytophthora cactorum]